MAGTLSVQKIQGLATSATPTTVEIASGHKLTAADAGAIAGKGNIINVTYLNHNNSGLTTSSTSFVNYTNSNITVTKLKGPGNVSGGSYLLILGSAWIEYNGSSANSRHLAYSLMRDGTELTGLTYGLGNLYAGSASGYQSSADMNFVDTANLNAGSYVYSMCIKSVDGTVNVQIGNGSRMGSWAILEIAQ